MQRLRKEIYISEETKQLNELYQEKVKEDKNKARALRIVAAMNDDVKPFVLQLLSVELSAK